MGRFIAGVSDGWADSFVVDPETGEEIKNVVWVNENLQVLKRFVDGNYEDAAYGRIEQRPCLLVHEV
jgi:hypothetical protein